MRLAASQLHEPTILLQANSANMYPGEAEERALV